MAALSDNRDTRELGGENPVSRFTAINADILYAGGIMAIDYAGEIQPATDTIGLRVIGRCPAKVDNTSDGEYSEAERGIYRFANSTSYAITRSMIGDVCYVEDDQTVGSGSTNLVAAGLVHDVDTSGVWVDMRPEALAVARRIARPKVVAVTATTGTVSAAQAFQGNIVVTAANASATTLTFVSAVAGYRIGIQRINAGAGYDVILQAPSGDTIRGSTVAGTASNTTDAVSDILWLEAENATNWTDAAPLAADRAVWVAST